ncbi:MAG: PAS-domain containing protein, partial [Rhizobiales bacterium]|nr:PAS-domain containing protein [Hyphomicrobiales bacterium]
MPWHRRKTKWIRRVAGPSAASVALLALLVSAASADPVATLPPPAGIVGLSAGLGLLLFSLLSVGVLLRARRRADQENAALRLRLADIRSAADRAEALADADDQRLVAYGASGEPPLVMGRLPEISGAPDERSAFLAFGTWLPPSSASRLEAALERLRSRGETFRLTLELRSGSLVEVVGRVSAGRAVARFRDLTGDRLALAELEARHRRLGLEVGAMRALFEATAMPAWIRNREGRLEWVNAAFARAVEATDPADAVARGVELLDTAGRQQIIRSHAAGPIFAGRLPIVVAGDRRLFDVVDVVSEAGSAGLATDATELETAQAQMRRLAEFHARTLDQLATAVAIFGADRRLRSYNAAFRALFGLDDAFLATMPSENAVLDAMRAARRLPEQADFKGWRGELLSAYQSVDAREHWWHLPDGQTLRVIANPHPLGGMTWIYENVTERLDLESRYNALMKVQGETLDHLSEGVAVFGSDGRLRLHNPAFAEIWQLDEDLLAARPHVGEIVRAARRLHDGPADWTQLTGEVIGLGERRAPKSGRMERQDGHVLDFATIPLPNGQTMVTFVDVSDSVRVARALGER